MEAGALLPGGSAQRAKLVTLTSALELEKDKILHIYADSKYAYSILGEHGVVWKERRMLSSGNKHSTEILCLLEAIKMPQQVAVIHCQGHRKGGTEVIQGNNRADLAAPHVAIQGTAFQLSLLPSHLNLTHILPPIPQKDMKKLLNRAILRALTTQDS